MSPLHLLGHMCFFSARQCSTRAGFAQIRFDLGSGVVRLGVLGLGVLGPGAQDLSGHHFGVVHDLGQPSVEFGVGDLAAALLIEASTSWQ